MPEKAVAESVDHIEERVEAGCRLPERRQRMDRIERAAQEREWNDDEMLEHGELVELVRPHAGQQSERAKDGAAEQRENERPQRMRHREQRGHEEQRDDETTKPHTE